MKLSAEIIQDRMFQRFKKAAQAFFKKREDRYMEQFSEKLSSGKIDVKDPNYKEICKNEAEKFFSTAPKETSAFIKTFVLEETDRILDCVKDGKMDKEEGEISFKLLKHILIAGEIEIDPTTKLK